MPRKRRTANTQVSWSSVAGFLSPVSTAIGALAPGFSKKAGWVGTGSGALVRETFASGPKTQEVLLGSNSLPSGLPASNSSTMPPPSRVARSSRAASLQSSTPGQLVRQLESMESSKHISEAAYLYGFVDPDFADRGPSSSEFPTILATFKSHSPISIVPYTADTAAWPTTTSYMADSNNALAFVICPCIVYSSIPSTNGEFVPGYCYSPSLDAVNNFNLFHSGGTGASGAGPPVPLMPFSSPFPTAQLAFGSDPELGSVSSSYRLVGLRATLTISQSAIYAQGVVMGGDSNDVFEDNQIQYLSLDSSTNATPGFNVIEFSEATEFNFTNPPPGNFGNFANFQRVKELGAVTNGAIFEACYLPTNDRALDYNVNLPVHRVTNLGLPNDCVYGDLVNYPAVLFSLQNISTTTIAPMSISLDVSATYEIPVYAGSPLAFLVNQARFMPRFLVDWTLLQTLPSAGTLASILTDWVAGPYGSTGLNVALGKLNPPPGRIPENQGVGAVSATSRLSGVASFAGKVLNIAKAVAPAVLGAL